MTQRGSTTVTPMPWAVEPVGHLDADGGHRADADDEHVPGAAADEDVAAAGPVDRRDVVGRRALGQPHDRGGVVDGDGLAQQLAHPGAVARRGEPQPGHDLEDRHVPHAVVAGAVVAGDAGAVEHEVTPHLCSATSISTWSKARLRKVA